jgi:hypothetical protein
MGDTIKVLQNLHARINALEERHLLPIVSMNGDVFDGDDTEVDSDTEEPVVHDVEVHDVDANQFTWFAMNTRSDISRPDDAFCPLRNRGPLQGIFKELELVGEAMNVAGVYLESHTDCSIGSLFARCRANDPNAPIVNKKCRQECSICAGGYVTINILDYSITLDIRLQNSQLYSVLLSVENQAPRIRCLIYAPSTGHTNMYYVFSGTFCRLWFEKGICNYS